MLKDRIEALLLKVKSPSRYIGGGLYNGVKDKNKEAVSNCLFLKSNFY